MKMHVDLHYFSDSLCATFGCKISSFFVLLNPYLYLPAHKRPRVKGKRFKAYRREMQPTLSKQVGFPGRQLSH